MPAAVAGFDFSQIEKEEAIYQPPLRLCYAPRPKTLSPILRSLYDPADRTASCYRGITVGVARSKILRSIASQRRILPAANPDIISLNEIRHTGGRIASQPGMRCPLNQNSFVRIIQNVIVINVRSGTICYGDSPTGIVLYRVEEDIGGR